MQTLGSAHVEFIVWVCSLSPEMKFRLNKYLQTGLIDNCIANRHWVAGPSNSCHCWQLACWRRLLPWLASQYAAIFFSQASNLDIVTWLLTWNTVSHKSLNLEGILIFFRGAKRELTFQVLIKKKRKKIRTWRNGRKGEWP